MEIVLLKLARKGGYFRREEPGEFAALTPYGDAHLIVADDRVHFYAAEPGGVQSEMHF